MYSKQTKKEKIYISLTRQTRNNKIRRLVCIPIHKNTLRIVNARSSLSVNADSIFVSLMICDLYLNLKEKIFFYHHDPLAMSPNFLKTLTPN